MHKAWKEFSIFLPYKNLLSALFACQSELTSLGFIMSQSLAVKALELLICHGFHLNELAFV